MSRPFSIVFNFFRSLSLAHLERSLFSLAKQTVKPSEFLLYCNDVEFDELAIIDLIDQNFLVKTEILDWPKVNLVYDNHGDPSKRNASYAQNKSIRMAKNDLFIFTKADCIYREDFCERLLAEKTDNPMEFVAPHLYQMHYWSQKGKPHDQVDHAADLEELNWRENVRNLDRNTDGGQLNHHATIDAPCFCTTKQAMERASWYDEAITQWSYWQPDLQGNMVKRGVQMKVVPETLVYHMMHGLAPEEGERDLHKAHAHWLQSPRRKDPAFQ